MRTLVIAEQYPWPPVDGYRQRLGHVISGLARLGDVEVLTLDRYPAGVSDVPELPDGVVAATAVDGGVDAGVRSWFGPWLKGPAPRRILGPDWSAAEAVLRERMSPAAQAAAPIDVVWFSHVDTWWPLSEVPLGPTAAIVDFDNLENLAMRLRRFTPPDFADTEGPGDVVRVLGRWAASRGFDVIDQRRWDRAQRRCADAADAVVVCSELDRQRSGVDNAIVVGNGATAPAVVRSDRRELRSDEATMVFVGALDYEPNTDAVRWFATDVLPLIRRRRPHARFVVIGRGSDLVSEVGDLPGVDLVGAVDDLQPYLDAADVSVVPIRVGAGTRLKVVEAMANHLPLATTTVGCEGIDVVDDVHALIADDARGLAAACLRLLEDPELRQRLADAGAELFVQRYDWAMIESSLADQVSEIVARRGGD